MAELAQLSESDGAAAVPLMPVHNFTISDLRAVMPGCALFPLFVFVPGYLAAWLLNLFEFRRRTLLFRAALSIPLSISLCPIVVYLLGSFLSMTAVAWLFYTLWLGFAVLLVRGRKIANPRPGAAIPLLAGVWTLLALLSLVDLEIGNRLYYSTISLDYSIRSLMIHSLAAYGVPARSPFFFPGHPVTLRYHYFWLIGCSLVKRLAGDAISSRQALIAGTPWCGLGLMGLIALYLRLFSPPGPLQIRRRTAIAIALLGVTGLDILPTAMLWMFRVTGLSGMIFPSLEWWNEQVDGWTYTMLWEPHHLSGMIACFTGFLLLWQTPGEPGRRGVLKYGVPAGVAFATAAGSSVHVTFVFAIFLAVWMAIAIWKKWWTECMALMVAGATSILLALPFLRSLTGPGSNGPPVEWTVRSFPLPDMFMNALGLRSWQIVIGNLLLLPMNYFLELGLFFVVGLWRWRIWRAKKFALGRQELAAGAMVAVSVLVCTFLRSSLIGNNDLGWRGFLIAQFALLLWTADLLADWPRLPERRLLVTLIALGAAGTLYDLVILRAYPILADAGVVMPLPWMTPDRQLGRRTYALRAAYQWADAATPPWVIIQHNPDVPVQDTAAGLYADRQAAASTESCLATFGGDPGECAPIAAGLKHLYSAQAGNADFEQACASLPIDILVAKDIDPAWRNPQGWVWQRKPLFSNEYVRLLACRGTGRILGHMRAK